MRNKELVKILKRFPSNAEIKIRLDNNGDLSNTFEVSASVNEQDEWSIVLTTSTDEVEMITQEEKLLQINEKTSCNSPENLL